MESKDSNKIQGNKFDKIFRENMQVSLPTIMKNTVGIEIGIGHDLPSDLQYTKERKPDLLRHIKPGNKKGYLLHIEYQTTNDRLMVCRMAEYNVMLRRTYKIQSKQSIRQYVLFFGKRKAKMQVAINSEELQYHYKLIQISEIDYELFLNSENPEDQILAILGDLKGNDPKHVLAEIMLKLHSVARGQLANNKYANQLQVLSQLRNFEKDFKLITSMGPISSFFKIEKDPFYKEGVEKGELKKAIEFARKLLTRKYPLNEIAELTELPIREIEQLQ
ncbi:hypothetical protein [Chitinophaga sp. CF418]|uniref:hypothetical protein n=1 Tax=Chitinophaga sp. CF418 TaxID=1855287 RepID=UPI000914AB68|nr:hypothetical protein [Chitinophaga sp. CF418]SHN45482.1 conserved hypothetical protein (putative transposase or invertase) [Chitinophaga sp. CF418]